MSSSIVWSTILSKSGASLTGRTVKINVIGSESKGVSGLLSLSDAIISISISPTKLRSGTSVSTSPLIVAVASSGLVNIIGSS